MVLCVLDASALGGWCFRDEQSAYSEALLSELQDHEAVAPAIWAYESRNMVLIGLRRGRLTMAEAQRLLAFLDAAPVRMDFTGDFAAIANLAMKSGLTAYDAAYLELAQRTGLPLATADDALIRAARAVGVPIYQPRP